MKPPYENNKVYAVASTRRGLKSGYVAAVFAQVRYDGSAMAVSTDPAHGLFFLADPSEFKADGGTADRWNPHLHDNELLVLDEEDGPLDYGHTHILSTWTDRESAWAEYEARRAAGRKGAETRVERQTVEKAAEQEAQAREARLEREASPLGRLKASTRGLENAFVAPARNGHPERVLVSLVMSADNFRKLAERRGADPALIEEFLAAERAGDL